MVAELLAPALTEDGRRLLVALAQDGFDVSAAGWLLSTAAENWHLCIVSRSVRAGELAASYHAVYARLRQRAGTAVEADAVRLLRPDQPLGAALLDLDRQFLVRPGGAQPVYGTGLELYGYSRAVLYHPPARRLSPQQVAQVVGSLLTDTAGRPKPATVHLRFGNSVALTPTGIRYESDSGRWVAEGLDEAGQPRQFPTDEIDDISF